MYRQSGNLNHAPRYIILEEEEKSNNLLQKAISFCLQDLVDKGLSFTALLSQCQHSKVLTKLIKSLFATLSVRRLNV
ncbi:hypothetical protein pb186bvf_018539, partial [Paramecium bursaria]